MNMCYSLPSYCELFTPQEVKTDNIETIFDLQKVQQLRVGSMSLHMLREDTRQMWKLVEK